MILVHGSDDAFVDEVIAHLKQCGHAALRAPAEAHLFSEVVAHKAATVIGLAARRPVADEGEQRALVDSLIAASTAPTSPRIVLVTPGPLDGPHVRALRRSGAPYVVVSSLGVRGLGASLRREQRTVWLSRQLLEREHAVVTRQALLCTIASAVAEDATTGVALTPDSASWREALQAAGVRVVAVPNWLARLAYLFRWPALYLATGRVCVGLDDDAAAVFGLLPSAAAAAPEVVARHGVSTPC